MASRSAWTVKAGPLITQSQNGFGELLSGRIFTLCNMKRQRPYARELMPLSAVTIQNGDTSHLINKNLMMSTMLILTGNRNRLPKGRAVDMPQAWIYG